jgi:sugar lactone lactonase YvrE
LIKVKDDEGASDESIKCPTCHESVSLPVGKVNGLTQNLWLARQVKIASLCDGTSDKVTPCDSCVSGDSSAVAFCSQCWVNLCGFCKEDHQRSRDTFNHQLIDKGKTPSFDKMSPMPVKCIKHVKEEIKFYCSTCEELACRDCILVHHKDHQYGDCDDVASDSCKEEMKQCASKVDSNKIMAVVDGALDNGAQMVKEIEKREGEVKAEINEAFDLLQHELESRRKYLLHKTEEIASNKKMSLSNQMETFDRLKGSVSQASKLIEAIVESNDSGEILSIKKLIKDQITRCANKFEELNFKIEANEKMFASFDVTTMKSKINSFGGVSTIPASGCTIDSGLGVPLATVGVERKFKVRGIDDNGKPVNDIPLNALVVSSDGNDEKVEEVKITSSDDCTTTVSFVPERVGEMKVSLLVGGQHINGSPCKISVKQKRDYSSLGNQLRSYNVGTRTYGVAVDTNGEVYASSDGGYIQVFNNDGTPTRRIGSSGDGNGQFKWPWGLVIVGETLYVTDHSLHRVQMFSTTTSQYIGQFGSKGSGQGQFNDPRGITHDGKGHILVADCCNYRVQVFTLDGTFVQVIDCDGQSVYDVAVDNDGNIHVPYYNQNIVQVFSSDGVTKLYSYNNPNGNFNNPEGTLIDDEGYCFIGSTNSSLHILDSTGRQVNVICGLGDPLGLAMDKEGHVYVADFSNKCIRKY